MNTLCTIIAFMGLHTPEIIVIALAVLLLFGGRKIPELMRGLGKGIRSFREGMNDISDELKQSESSDKK
ncbi:MAG: twin-arginine translocase TatA/TatE family subunit [Muribaculaceae bacterium]|nr:twin-arginine translocase TatA/TatE family subunit [Muribaculaceae bacterium]